MKPLFLPFLTLSLGLFSVFPASAAPEITIEVGGEARASGSTLRLAGETLFAVTDSGHFSEPSGPLNVSFSHVVAGEYLGQVSSDEEIWSDVTSLLVHPAPGTLSFSHDPGGVVNIFYRLLRVIEPSVEITIRNTGDMPLTGIDASLTGADAGDFMLDDSGTDTSLAPGSTTTLTGSFSSADMLEHHASLQIASNDADENPFVLALVGNNDPGPIQSPVNYQLVGVTWDHPGAERLCFVDTVTGAATPVSATRIENILGIAWDDATQTLYGTTTHLSHPKNRLVKIDPSTGATLSQHSIGIDGLTQVAEGDVAVQPSTGLVFCLRSGGGVQVWNPVTELLAYSFQLPTPAAINDYSTLAFNSAGDLFTIDPNSFTTDPTGIPQLHRINPLNGTILSTVDLSAPLGVVMGMTFHPLTDEAFVADSCDAEEEQVGPDICDGFTLYRLNITTGQLTPVGPTSVGFGLCGLTFMPDFTPASPAPELRVAGPVGEITNGQPTVFQFDTNAFGGGTGHIFFVHNDGSLEPLVLSSVTLPPGFTTLQTLPRTIEPGQSLALDISNTGPTQGVYEGNVVLTTNDADEGTFSFPIRALFNMPEITVGSGIFGSNSLTNGGALDVGTTRLAETRGFVVRVGNLHAGPLTVSGITLPNGYALAAPAPVFPFSLGKDQLRDISISIVSTTPGTFSGTLAIQNNDFDEGPFNIQLTGTVSPESILFFGFSTFINEGGSINASGLGSGPVTYAWDLDGDGEFDDATGGTVALPDADGPAEFLASVRMTDNLTSLVRTQTVPVNNVPPFVDAPFIESILAGVPLVLNVTANDVVADVTAGMTWRVDWGDGNLNTTAAGHAAATSFSHAFSQLGQADIQIDATDKDGGKGSAFRSVWVHSAVIGVFDGPDISGQELRDGQNSLSFATAFGGTADRPITVHNRSASPASIGPVTLSPGFLLVSPPAFPLTLAPGATTTLTVRFSPIVAGSSSGVFSLATSDPALPSFEIMLSGEASAPDILMTEFNGELFDFASDTQSFSISPGTGSFDGTKFNFRSDNSEAPLIIQSITLPPNFQLSPAPVFPLDFSSESSRDIRVQCSGPSPGFYEGWVSIVSNDPDESPFRFFVTSRVGSVADLLVKSDGSDLSSATGIILNGQSEALDANTPLTLRLRNQGNQALTVSAITLPAGYAFASPPTLPRVISAFSAAFTLPNILLTATAPGTYAGEVAITSTDPDENPYRFPITATIPDGDPEPPGLPTFTLTPATPGAGVVFSGTVTGPPNATVILEGSTDLGEVDAWTEISRVTLDGAGLGTITNATPPNTAGVPRYFVRLRSAP